MPQENNPPIYQTIGIAVCGFILYGLIIFVPPRNDEPITFSPPRVVVMPADFTGPMWPSANDASDACPGEETVVFERPEGLPDSEPDLWTCAHYVEAP